MGLVEPAGAALRCWSVHLPAGLGGAPPDDAARAAVERVVCGLVAESVVSGVVSIEPPVLPHLRDLARQARQARRVDEPATTLHAALGLCLLLAADYREALPALEHALALSVQVRGPEHPATRALQSQRADCRADLLLGPLPPSGPSQVVEVVIQARAAVAAALADPSADRRTLALALGARARWAEEHVAPGGGWMYAAELRMLIGPLGVPPHDLEEALNA